MRIADQGAAMSNLNFRKKLILAHRYSSRDADSTSDNRSLHHGKQAQSAIKNCQ
jgi:hypothetical protein